MPSRHISLDKELADWYDGLEDGLKSREARRILKLGLKADGTQIERREE